MFSNPVRKLRFSLKSVFILMAGIAIGFALGTSKWSKPPIGNNAQATNLFGVDLSQEPISTFNRRSTRYRGGMRVTKVRPSSAAAHAGILPGDIIVGLHRWETASDKDIRYVISRLSGDHMGKLKFYALRGENTFYGYLDMRAPH